MKPTTLAMGYPMEYKHPSEIMDEIARLTPTFTWVVVDPIFWTEK